MANNRPYCITVTRRTSAPSESLIAIISPAPPGNAPSKAVPGCRLANRRKPMPITVVSTNMVITSVAIGAQLVTIVCNDFAVIVKLNMTPITDWASR
jgi:hypothetical protein